MFRLAPQNSRDSLHPILNNSICSCRRRKEEKEQKAAAERTIAKLKVTMFFFPEFQAVYVLIEPAPCHWKGGGGVSQQV